MVKQNKYFSDMSFDNPIKDKQKQLDTFIKQMFNRTQSMFKYDGLPNTLPQIYLERYLQVYGHCVITEVNSDLYAFWGGFTGLPDPYYNATQYTISNVALNLYKTLDIDKDCVLCINDSNMQGLSTIFKKYGFLLVENTLTIYSLLKTARASLLLSASDDKTKRECELFIDKLETGDFYCIAENPFFDGVKSHSTINGAGLISQFIELEQYLKASCLNEIGLNANYNMKRESLNSAESALNDDFLIPLIDNMLACRKDFVNKVNNMYGTNITVELNSAWLTNKIEDMKQNSLASNDINSTEVNELEQTITDELEYISEDSNEDSNEESNVESELSTEESINSGEDQDVQQISIPEESGRLSESIQESISSTEVSTESVDEPVDESVDEPVDEQLDESVDEKEEK